MLYKLHYWLFTSGACAIFVLLGVFIETYTDASSFEIGALYMIMPFLGIATRPIICSMADRHQAHQKFIIVCLFVVAISYTPFVIIPFLGPQVYQVHGRLCWYFLVFFDVIGAVAFGGMVSIGDALAVNYASRIGTDFSVYRVWGTLSWMTFGLIIGQINEVSFLPKYVPAFMILITSTLIDMAIIWLWPPEYFEMVSKGHADRERSPVEERERGKLGAMTKSLMPKEVVWAHAKRKLIGLFCCGLSGDENSSDKINGISMQQVNSTSNQLSIVHLDENHTDLDDKPLPTVRNKGMTSLIRFSETKDSREANACRPEKGNDAPVDKKLQIQLLKMLFKKDPRIFLYLAYFVLEGLTIVPVSFFFMSLSTICHEQGTCAFSELAGMLQASTAFTETILFIYIKQIKSAIGRVNTCVLSLFLVSVKYLFYGTVFPHVSPYYSILFEGIHGVFFAMFLAIMVEMGHEFSDEVQFLIPDLMKEGIVKEESEAARLALSLAATMQALLASASDGIGRGFGALIFGFLLEIYSYETLWLIIGISASVCCAIALSISISDYIFDFRLGLSERK